MKIYNNSGFAMIWMIVLIAVIATSGIGYYVFQANKDEDLQVSQQSTPSQTQTSPQPQTIAEPAAESSGTIIKTADSDFGPILFDGAGQAIYIFELEEGPTAECYGDCAVAWPPVLTDGAPAAEGDVNAELLGTTERTDGTTQVTYNDHPLYYYAHEEPGEVKCHNIRTHGGLWWVVQPSGDRVI